MHIAPCSRYKHLQNHKKRVDKKSENKHKQQQTANILTEPSSHRLSSKWKTGADNFLRAQLTAGRKVNFNTLILINNQ